MVLIDHRDESIYAIVPADLVGRNIHALHETAVYELKHFKVSVRGAVISPVQTLCSSHLRGSRLCSWSIVLILCFRIGHTSWRHLRPFLHTVSLGNSLSMSLESFVPSQTDNEIRITLWGEAALRFNAQVIRFLSRDESAVVIFVGLTIHMYEGSKELSGATQCRWYINEDIQDINILRGRHPIAQLPAPREMNLRSPAYSRYLTRPISTLLNPQIFQNQDGSFLCDVTIWRLTPGQRWWFVSCAQCRHIATPLISSPAQHEKYTCSQDDCVCTDAALEYHLHLLGSDGTGEAEFTLSGRVAQDIIGVSPQRTILNNYRGAIPVTNLAIAAIQINHTPPELAAVMSCKYKFLIHVTANCFSGSWPSFSVPGIVPSAEEHTPLLHLRYLLPLFSSVKPDMAGNIYAVLIE